MIWFHCRGMGPDMLVLVRFRHTRLSAFRSYRFVRYRSVRSRSGRTVVDWIESIAGIFMRCRVGVPWFWIRSLWVRMTCLRINRMVILFREYLPVIAFSSEMYSAVSSTVGQIVSWRLVIEKGAVGVDFVDVQITYVVHRVEWPEEIFQCDEACIFRTGQHPAQVIVPDIQITVVGIHGIHVGDGYFCNIGVDAVEEIIIDFIQVVVLVGVKM